MDQPMDKERYAQEWYKESELFRKKMIYQWLASLIPDGNVLEFGCGSGQGTYQLLKKNSVLSIDNNDFLIHKAKEFLKDRARIHTCNFFELTEKDKKIIKDFDPKTIIGWFLGSDGEEVEKYTDKETNSEERWGQYRKKIENIITSPYICSSSIEYIHLANRNVLSSNYSEQEICAAIKKDYDLNVFSTINFEITNVQIREWPAENSNFQYIGRGSQNLNNQFTAIVSLLAKRTSS